MLTTYLGQPNSVHFSGDKKHYNNNTRYLRWNTFDESSFCQKFQTDVPLQSINSNCAIDLSRFSNSKFWFLHFAQRYILPTS